MRPNPWERTQKVVRQRLRLSARHVRWIQARRPIRITVRPSIDVDRQLLVSAGVTHVGGVGDHVEADVALDAKAPVVDDGRREGFDAANVGGRRRQWTGEEIVDGRVIRAEVLRRGGNSTRSRMMSSFPGTGRRRPRHRRGLRSCRRPSRPRQTRNAERHGMAKYPAACRRTPACR